MLYLTFQYNKPTYRVALPNILTMIGLGFTFFGIVVGLWNFDSQNIQESVPKLLDGLKVAFLSSLAGLILSLVIRFQNLLQIDDNVDSDGATIDTLASILKANNHVLDKINQNNLLKQNELIDSFNDFAKTQAENNSKSLIEALESVMRDFNTKINEQFGENFKQLNQAVARLLAWQENYYKQIEAISNQLEDSVKAIEKNEKILNNLSNKFSEVMSISEKYESLIEEMNNQKSNLNENLKVFSEISEDMRNVFPSIERNINSLTENLSSVIDNTNKSIENNFNVMKDNINDVVDNTNKSIQEMVNDTSSQVKVNTEEILTQHRESQERIDSIQKDIANSMIDNIRKIEKGMEDELNNALTGLGSGLAGISNKMVEDYEKLSESIIKIREIEKQINS